MARPLRVVNLAPPYEQVKLWLRLDHDNAWRIDSWEAPGGMNIPLEPPPTVRSTGFRVPRDAALYFARVLTSPSEVVPPAHPLAPGRMPPSPAVDYYWPPTLTDAVAGYERDMQAAKQDQVPVDRVLILGAGFSAAFQFTTARDIVTGTLGWAEHCQGSDWLARTYRQVRLESNLYKDGAWSPNGVQTRRP